MTMAEFVSLALQDELHPKIKTREEANMVKMRTLALQIPESLFQRIKEYLQRNNMSQKEFVLGLIENELDREQSERENAGEELEESAEEPDETTDDDEVESDGEDNAPVMEM